jgi:hypothetical protein
LASLNIKAFLNLIVPVIRETLAFVYNTTSEGGKYSKIILRNNKITE